MLAGQRLGCRIEHEEGGENGLELTVRRAESLGRFRDGESSAATHGPKVEDDGLGEAALRLASRGLVERKRASWRSL